jgi:hypothetical protein
MRPGLQERRLPCGALPERGRPLGGLQVDPRGSTSPTPAQAIAAGTETMIWQK